MHGTLGNIEKWHKIALLWKGTHMTNLAAAHLVPFE